MRDDENRDKHASDQHRRVRNINAMMIAAKIGVNKEQEEELSIAAMLHASAKSRFPANGVAGMRV